jgi:hypothetical protein
LEKLAEALCGPQIGTVSDEEKEKKNLKQAFAPIPQTIHCHYYHYHYYQCHCYHCHFYHHDTAASIMATNITHAALTAPSLLSIDDLNPGRNTGRRNAILPPYSYLSSLRDGEHRSTSFC